MEIKFTPQGLLIYLTMAAYAAAALAALLRRPRPAAWLYRTGFAIAVAAFAYRWFHVAHIPMQNLFEVFLTMTMLIYPISECSEKILRIKTTPADMILGLILAFPAAFIFSAEPRALPPALQCWLFAPHVAVYMLAYVLMAKAAVPAAAYLLGQHNPDQPDIIDNEQAAYRLTCLAFPLLSLGLILGSWWGSLAWGDFWGWDPKELWSLVSWLIYVAYFHFRYRFAKKYPRLNCLWIIIGLLAIVITLLWVNLSNLFAGMHSYAS